MEKPQVFRPKTCAEVEKAVKKAYGLVVSEMESFEKAYGSERPGFTGFGPVTCVEDYAPDSVFSTMTHLYGNVYVK